VTILYAIPAGILAGLLLRGRLDGLLELKFRWAWLAVAGLLVQVVLFTELGDRLAGDAAPTVYVASTLAVLVALLRNIRLAGLPIAAIGSFLNLAAILANGGAMPADPGALRLAGFEGPGDHTNSVVLAEPALRPLTDIFAVPAGIPLANVFSVGDVLIAVGVAWAIAAAMRRPASESPAPSVSVDPA
jgi:hypothetical protein